MMFLWLLYILFEARLQAYLIDHKGWKPNYIQLFITRGIVSILHGVILDTQAGWEYPVLVVFQTTTFWIGFDLLLNLFRGKPWNYKGKDSGWLDSLPDDIYWAGKVSALIGAIIFGYIYLTLV